MNRSVLGLILIFALALPAAGQCEDPRISVIGTAAVEVVPDEMSWAIEINNIGPETGALAQEHAAIVSEVLAFLKKTGIDEKKTQTTMVQLREHWERSPGKQSKKEFSASSRIGFTTADLYQYEYLWTRLSRFAGIRIQNVAFGYSKAEETYDEVLKMALAAAHDKAGKIVEAARCRLGEPVVIQEVPAGPGMLRSNVAMAAERAMPASGGKSYALGQIRIEKELSVTFDLHCKGND